MSFDDGCSARGSAASGRERKGKGAFDSFFLVVLSSASSLVPRSSSLSTRLDSVSPRSLEALFLVSFPVLSLVIWEREEGGERGTSANEVRRRDASNRATSEEERMGWDGERNKRGKRTF